MNNEAGFQLINRQKKRTWLTFWSFFLQNFCFKINAGQGKQFSLKTSSTASNAAEWEKQDQRLDAQIKNTRLILGHSRSSFMFQEKPGISCQVAQDRMLRKWHRMKPHYQHHAISHSSRELFTTGSQVSDQISLNDDFFNTVQKRPYPWWLLAVDGFAEQWCLHKLREHLASSQWLNLGVIIQLPAVNFISFDGSLEAPQAPPAPVAGPRWKWHAWSDDPQGIAQWETEHNDRWHKSCCVHVWTHEHETRDFMNECDQIQQEEEKFFFFPFLCWIRNSHFMIPRKESNHTTRVCRKWSTSASRKKLDTKRRNSMQHLLQLSFGILQAWIYSLEIGTWCRGPNADDNTIIQYQHTNLPFSIQPPHQCGTDKRCSLINVLIRGKINSPNDTI